MKLIFLDIDGVLNSHDWWDRRPKLSPDRTRKDFVENQLDPEAIARFKKLLKDTGAKVVLSSTWRRFKEDRELIREKVVDFIDVTPHFPEYSGVKSKQRGREIIQWLLDNPYPKCDSPIACPYPCRAMCQGHEVEKYVIIDDDGDFFGWQPLFNTSFEKGLTDEICDKIRDYLSN